ncbi:MAG: hypothetical protein ACYTDT_08135, partial [Planctomycetota bacterium]
MQGAVFARRGWAAALMALMAAFMTAGSAMAAPPTIDNVTWQDTDQDGTLDQITINTTTEIEVIGEPNITVQGPNGNAVTTAIVQGGVQVTEAIFSFDADGPDVNDTDSSNWTMVYTPDGTTALQSYDAMNIGVYNAANETDTGDLTGATQIDAAGPVMISAITQDLNVIGGNVPGQIDALLVTFTEVVDTVEIGDYTVSNPTYVINSATANPNGTVTFHLEELGFPDTGSTPTISYDPAGSAGGDTEDAGGNPQPLQNDATAAPEVEAVDAVDASIVSACTVDTDGNGTIDAIELEYSEDIAVVGASGGDYTVAEDADTIDNDHDGDVDEADEIFQYNVTGASANGTVVTLVIDEVSDANTDATPTISYVPTSGTEDAAGNVFDPQNFGNASDCAPPVMIYAETDDADCDGEIDQVVVEFSEDLTNVGGNNSYTVAGYNVVGVAINAAPDTHLVTLTLQEGGSNGAGDTGATPLVTYNGNLGATYDQTASPAYEQPNGDSIETVDGADPHIMGIITLDTDIDGHIDGVTVTFSEAVDILDPAANNGLPGWTVFDAVYGNYAIPNGAYGADDVTEITIPLNEHDEYDTDATPLVSYAVASNNVVDQGSTAEGVDYPVNGLNNVCAGVVAEEAEDEAPPVVISTYQDENNFQGALVSDEVVGIVGVDSDDTIILEFSETMDLAGQDEAAILLSLNLDQGARFLEHAGDWHLQNTEWQDANGVTGSRLILYMNGVAPGYEGNNLSSDADGQATASPMTVGDSITFPQAAGFFDLNDNLPVGLRGEDVVLVGDFNPVYWPSGTLATNPATAEWIVFETIAGAGPTNLLPNSEVNNMLRITITNLTESNLPLLHPKRDSDMLLSQTDLRYWTGGFNPSLHLQDMSSSATSGIQAWTIYPNADNLTILNNIAMENSNTEVLPLTVPNNPNYEPQFIDFEDRGISFNGATQLAQFEYRIQTSEEIPHGETFFMTIPAADTASVRPNLVFGFTIDDSTSTYCHNTFNYGDIILHGGGEDGTGRFANVQGVPYFPGIGMGLTESATGDALRVDLGTDAAVFSAGVTQLLFVGTDSWDERTDSIIIDTDGSGTYSVGDVVIAGVTPALGSGVLGNPFDNVMFFDAAPGGFYDPDVDAIICDTDFDQGTKRTDTSADHEALFGVPALRRYPAYIPSGATAEGNDIVVVDQISLIDQNDIEIQKTDLIVPESTAREMIGMNFASTTPTMLNRVVVQVQADRHIWTDDPAGEVGIFEPGIDELYTETNSTMLTDGATPQPLDTTPGLGVHTVISFLWASEAHQPDEQAGHTIYGYEAYRPGVDEAWYDLNGNGIYDDGVDVAISQGTTPGFQWANRDPEPTDIDGTDTWAQEGNISASPSIRYSYIDKDGDGRWTPRKADGSATDDVLVIDNGEIGKYDVADGVDSDNDGLIDEADEIDILVSAGSAAPSSGDTLMSISNYVPYAYYDENNNGRYDEHVDEFVYDTSNEGTFDRPDGVDNDQDGLIDEADENDIVISKGENQILDLADGEPIIRVNYTVSTTDFLQLDSVDANAGAISNSEVGGFAIYRDVDGSDTNGNFDDPNDPAVAAGDLLLTYLPLGLRDLDLTPGQRAAGETLDGVVWIDDYAADDGLLRAEFTFHYEYTSTDDPTPNVNETEIVPVDDTGDNAGPDYFVVVQSSQTIGQFDTFTVRLATPIVHAAGDMVDGEEIALKGIMDRAGGFNSPETTDTYESQMGLETAPGVFNINAEDPLSVHPNNRVNLNDIEFVRYTAHDVDGVKTSGDVVWAVGDNGALRVSVDGGLSWAEVDAGAPAGSNLNAVHASGADNNAWVVGDNGYFAYVGFDADGAVGVIADYTATVVAEFPGGAPNLNGVFVHTETGGPNFLFSGTGAFGVTAVGDDGAIVQVSGTRFISEGLTGVVVTHFFGTADNQEAFLGLTSVHDGSDSDFHDVYFLNEDEGWIVGEASNVPGGEPQLLVLHTRNGGDRWSRLDATDAVDDDFETLAVDANSIYMSHQGYGVIACDDGYVIQFASNINSDLSHARPSGWSLTVTDVVVQSFGDVISSDSTVTRDDLTDIVAYGEGENGHGGIGFAGFHGESIYVVSARGHVYDFGSGFESVRGSSVSDNVRYRGDDASALNAVSVNANDITFTNATSVVNPIDSPRNNSSAVAEPMVNMPVTIPRVLSAIGTGLHDGQLDAASFPDQPDSPHAAFGINLTDGYNGIRRFSSVRLYVRSEDASFDPNTGFMPITTDDRSGVALFLDDGDGFFNVQADTDAGLVNDTVIPISLNPESWKVSEWSSADHPVAKAKGEPVPVEWYIELTAQDTVEIDGDDEYIDFTNGNLAIHEPTKLDLHGTAADPETDTGERLRQDQTASPNNGADIHVVVRTSDKMDYRSAWTMSMRSDPASHINDAVQLQGDGLDITTWRGYRSRMPVVFNNLAQEGAEIVESSPSTAVLGIDTHDGNDNMNVADADKYLVERQDENLLRVTLQFWNRSVEETPAQFSPEDLLPLRPNGQDDDRDGAIDEWDELGVTLWRDADGNGSFSAVNDFPLPLDGTQDWDTAYYPFWTTLTIASPEDNQRSILGRGVIRPGTVGAAGTVKPLTGNLLFRDNNGDGEFTYGVDDVWFSDHATSFSAGYDTLLQGVAAAGDPIVADNVFYAEGPAAGGYPGFTADDPVWADLGVDKYHWGDDGDDNNLLWGGPQDRLGDTAIAPFIAAVGIADTAYDDANGNGKYDRGEALWQDLDSGGASGNVANQFDSVSATPETVLVGTAPGDDAPGEPLFSVVSVTDTTRGDGTDAVSYWQDRGNGTYDGAGAAGDDIHITGETLSTAGLEMTGALENVVFDDDGGATFDELDDVWIDRGNGVMNGGESFRTSPLVGGVLTQDYRAVAYYVDLDGDCMLDIASEPLWLDGGNGIYNASFDVVINDLTPPADRTAGLRAWDVMFSDINENGVGDLNDTFWIDAPDGTYVASQDIVLQGTPTSGVTAGAAYNDEYPTDASGARVVYADTDAIPGLSASGDDIWIDKPDSIYQVDIDLIIEGVPAEDQDKTETIEGLAWYDATDNDVLDAGDAIWIDNDGNGVYSDGLDTLVWGTPPAVALPKVELRPLGDPTTTGIANVVGTDDVFDGLSGVATESLWIDADGDLFYSAGVDTLLYGTGVGAGTVLADGGLKVVAVGPGNVMYTDRDGTEGLSANDDIWQNTAALEYNDGVDTPLLNAPANMDVKAGEVGNVLFVDGSNGGAADGLLNLDEYAWIESNNYQGGEQIIVNNDQSRPNDNLLNVRQAIGQPIEGNVVFEDVLADSQFTPGIDNAWIDSDGDEVYDANEIILVDNTDPAGAGIGNQEEVDGVGGTAAGVLAFAGLAQPYVPVFADIDGDGEFTTGVDDAWVNAVETYPSYDEFGQNFNEFTPEDGDARYTPTELEVIIIDNGVLDLEIVGSPLMGSVLFRDNDGDGEFTTGVDDAWIDAD